MKKLVTGVVIIAVSGVILYVASALAATPPPNTGVPLPDWSQYQWEIDHKVRPGEFLFMLAGYYYQDGRKWNWIYELNRNKIRNPNLIRTGQVLTIRVPKGWEPPIPYETWYERTKEQYSGMGVKYGVGAPGTEGPEGYVTEEEEDESRSHRIRRPSETEED